MAKLRIGRSRSSGSRDNDEAELLRWCREVVARVNALEPEMKALTDDALRALTPALRERLSRGETLDALGPEAFAAVREAAARALGQRHFDVQIMGGAALHLGVIAEMRTGEGKTLTATLPAYLHALADRGVHVLTANDYLAGRDAEWMSPVYGRLGLTVGLIRAQEQPKPEDRRPQYAADITYGEWSQFGYDFLRDSLAWQAEERVQRGHHSAIVDEADLILIDEFRTPLLLSGPAEQIPYSTLASLADRLRPGDHYQIDASRHVVGLTDEGARIAEGELGLGNLYDEAAFPLLHAVHNALKAKDLYRRDRDYVVAGDEAVVVDQTSGRPHPGRRYSDGVHEAVEAKEGLTVRPGLQTMASMPLWDYLSRYERLAGLTGAAASDAEIYRQIHQRQVVVIPTSKPVIRVDHLDVLYSTRQSKLAGLADETAARHAASQPVLVGAGSIDEAREISELLTQRGVSHQMLSAVNHAQDAEIIAGAGRLGAVTVVAKMAGRGVGIVLGGPDGAQRDEVAARGGLCVLGAERSGNSRLETHLRGRAGQQGDPGESRFFLSFEDPLVRSCVSDGVASFASRHNREGDEFARLSKDLDSLQVASAAHRAAWLRKALAVDGVLTGQRREMLAEREPAVQGVDISARIQNLIEDVVRREVAAKGPGLDAEGLCLELRRLYPVAALPSATRQGGPLAKAALPRIADEAVADARRAYADRERELGDLVIRDLERRVVLAMLDRAWREHAEAMPELLNTITLRLKDEAALAKYRREAGLAFNRMREAANREIVRALYYLHVEVEPLDASGADAACN